MLKEVTKTAVEDLQKRIDTMQELSEKAPKSFMAETYHRMDNSEKYLAELWPEQFCEEDAKDWQYILGNARLSSYLKSVIDDGLADGDFPETIGPIIWSEKSCDEQERKLSEYQRGMVDSIFFNPTLEEIENLVAMVEENDFSILVYSKAKRLLESGTLRPYTEMDTRQSVPLPRGEWEKRVTANPDSVDVAFSEIGANTSATDAKKLLACLLAAPFDLTQALRSIIAEDEREQTGIDDTLSALSTEELQSVMLAGSDRIAAELQHRRKAA